ncbi:thiosulfate/3-mercaptopyruvate sulfurtransferase [Pantoea agglomerans]|jgi:thiosulfate/3-mercaptopyruvate sulfurtransferase|uniref:Sulfurtransferase n=4 Tax=Bacteria TaxID=2 RepID=A0A379AC80_ENTAG|nr:MULTISPECIES: 3-mercaptopyruvate sulfurtransferase [Pseudomonadota]MDF9911460.1 thiosulfate/3-mercaptopyruvate sulfurtransferase [Pantoea brenneri]AYP22375.1 3-mercaptopyruvate sulfurtransferase [Pantoea agglomerans]AZI51922.1 3-mercaptopyruvate sulfurtransferase [Pantoea agglomerans]ERM10396.1 3-mercaptopyruvate sulfurtransferase [Pantoea agglomerans Tx10]KAF6676144.1 3-mercaptopyruvate sulfurtransferase [Pantoea sp. EKM21T]
MTTPLFVSADWLQEHYNDERLQVLDARLLPPGMEAVRDIQAEYLAGHLPDAPYFDIEALSDHTSPYPHMLPRAESFAVAMRELGVSSDKHLVVYDEGNLFSAPRAWWMLKTFGVAQVSILAGGLQGWKEAGFALATGEVNLPEGEFEAHADESRVKRLTDVLLISHEGGAQIIDARPANRFNAEVDEPRPGLHRGHIPNSLNVPWNSLVEQGKLKPEAELQTLFADAGVDITQPVVASCGSGVTAVVVILALTALGARDVTLYDGSWGEWGSRDDLPIAK